MRQVWRRKPPEDTVPVFIWKDSWFLLWHFFCWRVGRWVLAHFTEIRPLARELSGEFERHYDLFTELAARDSQARSYEQRIIQPTMYRLSAEAGRELCLCYACLMDIAPWQYGAEHRLHARKRMRNTFLISLLVFIVSCELFVPGSSFLARVILVAFLVTIISLAGWRASFSLHRMAREAKRLRGEEKKTV